MKIKYFIYYILFPASLCLAGFTYAQNTNFDAVFNAFGQKDFEAIEIELHKIDTTKISDYDKATWLYYYADWQFRRDNHHLAYKNILKAKKLFLKLEAFSDESDCNFLLINILSHQNLLKGGNNQIQPLIDEELKKANHTKDSTALRKVYYRLAEQFLDHNMGMESIAYFNKVLAIARQQKDTLRIAYCYDNIGTVHSVVFNQPDSSLYYAKKATPVYIKYDDLKSLSYNYNNQAQQYKNKKNYLKALQYFKMADSIPLKEFQAKSKIIFYENMSDAFMLNKDYKNAAIYFDKLNKLKDSINDTKQNIAISKIKEQFDNEKLRADNLESEVKRKQSQSIAVGLGGSLVLGSIIAFLIFKNTKRKQKLAEQEKVLETQKLATVLKEQELTTIDAMIEGQEKERQRIANDLHDDLGGLMATIKLHFNALKEKNSPELYDKTNTLIEEAYQKVRTVAHAKNSGVIAKQGLLKAVQNMADKVSTSNKIQIDVIDHGLDNRLENSLELTLFRVIQELITNIIKHAQATEVNIHLTNHEDSINIMVEDNGVGFNPKQITKTNKGMGISSIDKRITHLDGSMTIESEKNKGTTIIIDIPV